MCHDAFLAAQTFQHDMDLVFGVMLLAAGAAVIARQLSAGTRTGGAEDF